jgi:hypothetical protein
VFSQPVSLALPTTKSTPTTPSLMSGNYICDCFCFIFFCYDFEIILSKLAAIVAIPLSKDFSETSINLL